jgi:hypothetical protein
MPASARLLPFGLPNVRVSSAAAKGRPRFRTKRGGQSFRRCAETPPDGPGSILKQFEYCLVFLDRLELRQGAEALVKLNELGSEGWHVVHVREDPAHNRDLAFFMQREKPAA